MKVNSFKKARSKDLRVDNVRVAGMVHHGGRRVYSCGTPHLSFRQRTAWYRLNLNHIYTCIRLSFLCAIDKFESCPLYVYDNLSGILFTPMMIKINIA